jgi:hypothetical protein
MLLCSLLLPACVPTVVDVLSATGFSHRFCCHLMLQLALVLLSTLLLLSTSLEFLLVIVTDVSAAPAPVDVPSTISVSNISDIPAVAGIPYCC